MTSRQIFEVMMYNLQKEIYYESASERLEKMLRGIAQDLNLSYIEPTFSHDTKISIRDGNLSEIASKYKELLKYFGISKEMMTI